MLPARYRNNYCYHYNCLASECEGRLIPISYKSSELCDFSIDSATCCSRCDESLVFYVCDGWDTSHWGGPYDSIHHKRFCNTFYCIYCYGQELRRYGFYEYDGWNLNEISLIFSQYVRDRISDHNQYILDPIRDTYHKNIELMVYGFVSQNVNRYHINTDCIAVILLYINDKMKIKSFMNNNYCSMDRKSNIIKHIKYCDRYSFFVVSSSKTISSSTQSIYYATIKILSIYQKQLQYGYKYLPGFYIGILSENHASTQIVYKPIMHLSNCYVYGRNGDFYSSKGHHNGTFRRYEPNDIIKCIVDMLAGFICFIKNDSDLIAFPINKYIDYKLIVAVCHQNDSYQLI